MAFRTDAVERIAISSEPLRFATRVGIDLRNVARCAAPAAAIAVATTTFFGGFLSSL